MKVAVDAAVDAAVDDEEDLEREGNCTSHMLFICWPPTFSYDL